MIADLILIIIVGVANFFVGLFPLAGDTSGLASSLATIHQYWATMNNIAPLTLAAILTGLALMVAIDTSIWGYKVIKWIYNKIPGIN